MTAGSLKASFADENDMDRIPKNPIKPGHLVGAPGSSPWRKLNVVL